MPEDAVSLHGGDARWETITSASPSGERIRLHLFRDTAPFGRRLARALGCGAVTVAVHRFPDGESLMRVRRPVGAHAVVVRSLQDPNAKLVEVLLAADALRRAGARRVTLVAPYLPYMRQDRVFAPGQALSQCVVGAWLGRAFDAVLTVEPHLHRVRRLRDVVPGRARSVSAAPAVAGWIRRHAPEATVVGPDAESAPWVRAIASMAGLGWAVGRKARLGDRVVRLRVAVSPACRHVVLVDDIATTGGTLAAAARALRAEGVRRVDAVVVHALFVSGALARVRAAGVARVVSCDTIPHPTNAIRSAGLLVPLLLTRR